MKLSLAGKHSWLILIAFSSLISAKVEMRLTDMQTRPIKELIVGEPAILEVLVHEHSKTIQAPVIEHLDMLNPKNLGFGMTHIGQQQTIKYRYRIFATEPGSYTIGPALNPRSLTPLDETQCTVHAVIATSVAQRKKSAPEPVLFRIFIDKSTITVGEQFTITTRFYYANDTISLTSISEPFCEHATKKEVLGPQHGQEEIQGILYNYSEWEHVMVAHKSGKAIICACNADYEQITQQQNQWSPLARWMGTYVEQKRIYSNALTAQINVLPSSDKDPIHIGTLKSVSADIAPGCVKEGDGMTLTLEFTSEESIDGLKKPSIQGLPDSLKCYDSKQVHGYNDGIYSKKFEYIVQGMQPGSYEIPAQSFTFFDTKAKAYASLSTASLHVMIQPKGLRNTNQTTSENPLASLPDALPLHRGPWHPTPGYKPLSVWTLLLLLLAPYLVTWLPWIQATVTHWYNRNPFWVLRRKLKQSRKEKNSAMLYLALQAFFEKLTEAKGFATTQSSFAQLLQSLPLTPSEQADWARVHHLLSAATYGQSAENDVIFITDLIAQLLDQLEKKI